MKSHKSKTLEDECLCSKCTRRFECFTQERVFSDPIFQGLFEALMANGLTKEEALEKVTTELKIRMNRPAASEAASADVYIDWDKYANSGTPQSPQWTFTYEPSVTITNRNDDMVDITYTMTDGNNVSWSANVREFNRIG